MKFKQKTCEIWRKMFIPATSQRPDIIIIILFRFNLNCSHLLLILHSIVLF